MTLRIEATVGTKGQAVIPKPIRDQMGIRPGDKVYFRIEAGRVVVETGDRGAALDAFLSAYEKRSLPQRIDWDAEAGSQAEHRFDRAL